jgi:hypothetical protein
VHLRQSPQTTREELDDHRNGGTRRRTIIPPATPDYDETEIVAAAMECEATAYLQDDGHSIVFDGISVDEVLADPFSGLSCVTNELLPDFMVHVIGATATMEGGLVVTEVDGLVTVTGRYPDVMSVPRLPPFGDPLALRWRWAGAGRGDETAVHCPSTPVRYSTGGVRSVAYDRRGPVPASRCLPTPASAPHRRRRFRRLCRRAP